ncbi:hypothetical protein PHLH7_41840 [Pseudomonas sp. Ost2]|uniref:BrnA antitoxin family protein n=1 Tax=Pseudomonas TaxID=286 RepID=UPI00159FA2F7|nr:MULTISPECIES: BrnA antitoxin family protein [Pseudomonas]NVZ64751.1 BrnA antitoxin family protein [Pseudomonas gingeri]NVZ78184.1 BrnA antitoxin family protein [Pseudomonas gingeri]BBP78080.1 hypothetical protein PHLH7_41840 [Pseudomonas sp. Ost2]
MKEEYDFSKARRGAVASSTGKTRITIMLDDEVIDAARALAESAGTGYQTIINNLLRQALISHDTHNLAPAPRKRAEAVLTLNEGIGRYEVQALEQQLIAVAGELNRVLGKPKKPRTRSGTAS